MNDLHLKIKLIKPVLSFGQNQSVKTKEFTIYYLRKSSLKPDYFILDENRNVKARKSPKLVKGLSGKALEFSGDYDRVE